mmetsp:Transcript_16857/g.33561  ORF Transcript_16857/g.33561 Transcript_16857/m.33561 type:complete len:460 (+) Transcript_16857:230-1609(+)|eukprot:CAMPEP_0194335432 /NCGR_PEP_ID=MMETSP0171-20130528/69550_1 /TAXON_ID=218684 /ORGANISM="Corethron pennatum, Strain L29A3" /LENGTH=459 /DNA_ID=CAMNT_0039098515 /DNA_START=210 /DNA_END=1589 /DNA_ORIENTATION=+
MNSNQALRNNAYDDFDTNTIYSIDDTVFTNNDRDTNRTGIWKNSLSRHLSKNNTSAESKHPMGRFDNELRATGCLKGNKSFNDDDESKASFLTWQPAAPGSRRMHIAQCIVNNSKPSDNEATANSWNIGGTGDSYVGGKIPNSAHVSSENNENNHSGLNSTTHDVTGRSFKTCDYTVGSDTLTTVGEDEVYIVKQKYGYLSISLSVIHVFVMAGMIAMCGLAPPNVNPTIGPYPDAMSMWGAKNAYAIVIDSQWWRTLSSSMLHVGFFHLFFNLTIQLETASFFEREWGSVKWLIIYLTSSYGSTVFASIMAPEKISVVSSGSIMGLFGAKLAELLCRMSEKIESKQQIIGKQVRIGQLHGVICSIIVIGLVGFIPFIDWSAHVGGLVTGFLGGIILFSSFLQPIPLKIFGYLIGVLCTVILLYRATTYLAKMEVAEELVDVCEYYQRRYWDDFACTCA